jgi:hypothetical protein
MGKNLTIVQLESDEFFEDMVRVHHEHRPNIGAGQICKITCGSRSAMAVARGAKSNSRDTIAVSGKTRKSLGISAFNESVTIEISEAGLLDQIIWGCRASDPIARIATQLGLLSLILGMLGVVLGIVSIIK